MSVLHDKANRLTVKTKQKTQQRPQTSTDGLIGKNSKSKKKKEEKTLVCNLKTIKITISILTFQVKSHAGFIFLSPCSSAQRWVLPECVPLTSYQNWDQSVCIHILLYMHIYFYKAKHNVDNKRVIYAGRSKTSFLQVKKRHSGFTLMLRMLAQLTSALNSAGLWKALNLHNPLFLTLPSGWWFILTAQLSGESPCP